MKVLVATTDRVEASEHVWPHVSPGWGVLRRPASDFSSFHLNHERGSVRARRGFTRSFFGSAAGLAWLRNGMQRAFVSAS